MDSQKKEIRKIKRANIITALTFAVLFLTVIAAIAGRSVTHSFTTKKWVNSPETRTRIVDDLLADYKLVGMTEAQVEDLLGTDYNQHGYFEQENRFVYYMGPERGLISIDSEWLVLDFENGVVAECAIQRD